jgi:nitroreductase
MNNPVLEAIKTRRVIRAMTDQPIETEKLEAILEAARWSPTGGNLKLNRFVVVNKPRTLSLLTKVSPGMFQRCPVVIVICVDWEVVRLRELPSHSRPITMDVGAAAQTMMLAAHSMGLATGPVTSFSKTAVKVVLNLPENLSPEMFVCVGYAAPQPRGGMRAYEKVTWRDLTYWDRFEDQ